MEGRTLINQNIIQNLSFLQSKELKEVETFVKFLLFKNKQFENKSEPKTLSGIWENIGFEKIIDLDSEINSVREEIGENILNKTF